MGLCPRAEGGPTAQALWVSLAIGGLGLLAQGPQLGMLGASLQHSQGPGAGAASGRLCPWVPRPLPFSVPEAPETEEQASVQAPERGAGSSACTLGCVSKHCRETLGVEFGRGFWKFLSSQKASRPVGRRHLMAGPVAVLQLARGKGGGRGAGAQRIAGREGSFSCGAEACGF